MESVQCVCLQLVKLNGFRMFMAALLFLPELREVNDVIGYIELLGACLSESDDERGKKGEARCTDRGRVREHL